MVCIFIPCSPSAHLTESGGTEVVFFVCFVGFLFVWFGFFVVVESLILFSKTCKETKQIRLICLVVLF